MEQSVAAPSIGVRPCGVHLQWHPSNRSRHELSRTGPRTAHHPWHAHLRRCRRAPDPRHRRPDAAGPGPFLLLDEFGTDRAEDYIAGFPEHPHRGFETVTYMLDGRMRHRDNHGNEGLLTPGSVQWMTAGRGLVHSEMPEQESGQMRGFQLWVNLPAKEKMTSRSTRSSRPSAFRWCSRTPAWK
jgi:redox-sensitive bicupin YhaK (pirin superfamily)